MKAYRTDYDEDIPGKANIAYHSDCDDIVIDGFMNSLQIKERKVQHLKDIKLQRLSYKRVVKQLTRNINDLEKEIYGGIR